ncbi:dephospho-CoA kinase [Bacillus sp. FJAT-49732]|uniref:Dephospho-CoA kinase n=1 Tax=Lederbergia citrisecunda TaxID=2833583 RepID=A0A942YLS1_9BACI|nr:dephospho-CoA kinase [Lederbergia citrisecunda]MBS4199940.1 dephospho-CoA kinase [Lederbergia citrisecunda]
MPKMIGLTGSIASGKSTVSNMLKDRGFTILDADIAARVVVEPGQKAYHQIIETFGHEIVNSDDTINRSKLGSIIFNDEEKRKMLNSIVHPTVRECLNDWKIQALEEGKKTIIYDIPLLYESNLTYLVEKVVVVFVDEDVQLKRLLNRNGLTEEEALARIRSQLPLREKKERADAVIDNNGTIDETERQVNELITNWKLEP